MATLLKCGALFLHVPKTGGNWVSDVLEAQRLVFAHVGGKHAALPQLAPLLRLLDVPRRYNRANRPPFTFCVVRHPLRWYESWYRMNVALGWPEWHADEDAWNPTVHLNGLGAGTFTGFIENVLRHEPGFLTALYDHYASDAHFVGRQERVAADLLAVLEFLNVPVDGAAVAAHRPVNVSARVEADLAPDVRAALEEAERDAFVRYGYGAEAAAAPAGIAALFRGVGSRVPLAGPFVPDGGFAWRADLPELAAFADDTAHPERSLLTVLEDGVPLAGDHAAHAQIRSHGRGRFSHWGRSLLFATGDNSDPNRNGRRYELRWAPPAPPDCSCLIAGRAATLTGAFA